MSSPPALSATSAPPVSASSARSEPLRTSRERLVWSAGVIAAVIAGGAAVLVGSALVLGYDLRAYWMAGRHLMTGAPLYPGPSDLLGLPGEFRYPPLVAVPFMVLAPLPFDIARWPWLAVQVAAVVGIALVCLRPLPRAARPWAVAGLVFFLPLVLEVTLGNLNLITCALCVAAWRWRDRAPVGGALLAAALGLKLLPLSLLVFYLASGRWRMVAWAAALGFASVALTALVMPDRLVEYLRFIPRLREHDWLFRAIDRTEPAALAAVFWSDIFPNALALGVLALTFAAGRAARAGGERATTLHAVALAIVPYLAPFGYFWTTFLVVTIPLFADTLRRALALRTRRARFAAVAVVALAWGLMEFQQLHDLVPILAHLVSVLLLVGTALVLLARPAEVIRTPSGTSIGRDLLVRSGRDAPAGPLPRAR
ncbi:MAG: glycosyltransferase 87 family protein [Chloroflexota bacterium]|nr:glycosyltransferase 87 family protein [Chloroflexota bacterium]